MIAQIKLSNNLAEITRMSEELENLGNYHQRNEIFIFRVTLTLDELITNIISYGFKDNDPHQIHINIVDNIDGWEIEIVDDGIAFDPLQAKDPDLEAALEDRKIGGLGVYFAKYYTRNIEYERVDDKNHLRLFFAYNQENNPEAKQ